MTDNESDPLGLEMYTEVFGEPNQRQLTGLHEITVNHLFAHVWSRPGLSVHDRRLITIALLAAQGQSEQLKKHIRGALRRGFSKEEIPEIMIHVAHYAGWAAGTTGQEMALEVLREIKMEADADKQFLMELNKKMGENEKSADIIFFQDLLADNFLFRRANGDVVNREAYLQDLEQIAENPYERLDTHIREVVVDKDSAVTTVLVIAKRKKMEQPGGFNNVRMFERRNGKWKLVSWINTKQD